MQRMIGFALLAFGAALSSQAFGCGACIEDQIAATYDHAVVQRAEARRHLVVYGQIDGAGDANGVAAKLSAAAGRIRGIDKGTVRTSVSPSAFSFALDPAVQGPDQAVAALQKRLRSERVTLSVLRVIGIDDTQPRARGGVLQ